MLQLVVSIVDYDAVLIWCEVFSTFLVFARLG